MTESWSCESYKKCMHVYFGKVCVSMQSTLDMWNDKSIRWCIVKAFNYECAM